MRENKQTNIDLQLHISGLEKRGAISGNTTRSQFRAEARSDTTVERDWFGGASGHSGSGPYGQMCKSEGRAKGWNPVVTG